MTDPRVYVCPADNKGVGFYRLIAPAACLIADGYPVTLHHQGVIVHGAGEAVHHVDYPEDADVIVFQRPLSALIALCIPWLQARGVAVVVEIDDDFDSIHPDNLAWHASSPKAHAYRNRQWIHRACKAADLVTVSTPALAQRYGYGHVRVLRNCVPTWYLGLKDEANEPLHVGWTGAVATHPEDLQVMGPAIRQILEETEARFAVVGTGERVHRTLRLAQHHQVPASGWMNLAFYPRVMAELDIGVVPLTDTPFNRAKSHLKGLEFAAVGVPFVASDVAEYRFFNSKGAGVLVTKPKQWRSALLRLVRDESWRVEVAGAGLEAARGQTVEAHAWRWFEAWADAVMIRSGHGAALGMDGVRQ